jgi:hypothetical protein
MKELIRKQSSSLSNKRHTISKKSCPVLLESFTILCQKNEFITNLENSKCKNLWKHLVQVCGTK